MCGIAGFITIDTSHPRDYFKSKILTSLDFLSKRGPDSSGFWIDSDEDIVLGHTRLEINGLGKEGSQPMTSDSGRYVISFNGEIYNHKILRKEISKNNWNGSSDTETFLGYLEEFGLNRTLEKVEGMFAIGLWDKNKKELTLIRDRFGEKPLYFELTKEYLNFASEIEPLTTVFKNKRNVNINAIESLLSYGYVSDKISIYNEVSKVQPGTYIKFSKINEKIFSKTTKYWKNISYDPLKVERKELTSELEEFYLNKVESNLCNIIKQTSSADVEVGLFLSGGVDSSYLATQLTKNKDRQIKTFSMGFDQPEYDETEYSDEVSKILKTDHQKFICNSNDIYSIISNMDKIYSEPFADMSSIPTILLSRLTSNHVKVVLGGDGADEILGGYERYQKIFNEWNLINKAPISIRKFISDSTNILPIKPININTGNAYYEYRNSCWKQHKKILITKLNSNKKAYINETDSIRNFLHFDQKNYLPGDILTKSDRASMSYGLEIRSPFLNGNLIELLNKIPNKLFFKENTGKYILKSLLYRNLPKKLFTRRKKGFGAPLEYWLRNELRDWAQDLLNPTAIKRQGYFNSNIVSSEWEKHMSEKSNRQCYLWPVLMFQQWLAKEGLW